MQVKKGVKQRSKISLGLLCRALCITRNFSDSTAGYTQYNGACTVHDTSLKMHSSSFYYFHPKMTFVDVKS